MRYDAPTDRLLITVDGVDRLVEMGEGDAFVCPVDWLTGIRATNLRDALLSAGHVPRRRDVGPSSTEPQIGLWPSTVSEIYWERKYIWSEVVTFEVVLDGRLVVKVSADMDLDAYDDDIDSAALIEDLLWPTLVRERATLISSEMLGGLEPPWAWEVRFAPSLRGRDVHGLIRLGEGIGALLTAAHGGSVSRATALDLLRAGRADLLLGLPEGHWLDVKQQPYDVRTPEGQISLARAVSRFANAEAGGLLIIGMKARKVPGGEQVAAVTAFPASGADIRRHEQAIEGRVFPLVDNLVIEQVPAPGGDSLIVIDVPPQHEDLKPFLVTGAIVDGKVEGAFISIVRRRGEASVPISAPAIHAYLAAGRSLFRRGVLPDDPAARTGGADEAG
jgi:hypothetical protein